MTTIRLEAHVDQTMVWWIQEKGNLAEAAALVWLRRQYENGLNNVTQWHVPALQDGELVMLHVDGVEEVKADGGEVWES